MDRCGYWKGIAGAAQACGFLGCMPLHCAAGSGDAPMSARKAIITCAVTGSIHTPSMSPYLPITAEQIADAAVGAAEAGAAIIHLHARNPEDGRPDQSPEAFRPILASIKRRSDCVINITTGGAPAMTLEERLKPCAVFKPEVASLNMGAVIVARCERV